MSNFGRGKTTTRERLIEAARNVFARYGYEGATTRRIAQQADVNEVTMFRLFGSKGALLDEAVRLPATGEHAASLPDSPSDPVEELTRWCTAEIHRLSESRAVILQCLAEEQSHPILAQAGAAPLTESADQLRRYASRLPVPPSIGETERQAAVTMLLAVLYSDALGRHTLPGVHRLSPEDAPGHYARLFLRALQI